MKLKDLPNWVLVLVLYGLDYYFNLFPKTTHKSYYTKKNGC